MLRNYHTAKHIITVHTAGLHAHHYNAIIGRVHGTNNAKDFAVIETPSITYIIFTNEVLALRTMLDLHGIGTIGFTRYAPAPQTVQYNYCENGVADFFDAGRPMPQPKSFN